MKPTGWQPNNKPIMNITDTFFLAHRLGDTKDTVKAFCGETWPARVKEYGDIIREQMRRTGKPLMVAVLALAEKANADHQNMIAAVFIAVGVELVEQESAAALQSNPKTLVSA